MRDGRLQRTAITPDDWSLGSPDAKVRILEYGDFECPYCAMARPELEAVVEHDAGRIRLIFRHFPLITIHPHAMMAAEAAEAAGAQGSFWPMHDMLFTHQQRLEYPDLLRYADALGLETPRFEQEMVEHVHLPEVRMDFRRGITDGVNGTPTLFINGVRYDGPRNRSSIAAAIDALMGAGSRAGL